MESIAFGLKDALRGLRRDRLYAATVVATLALTIGATTAVFTVVNGVLLAPLPYPQADRLYVLEEGVQVGSQYPWVPVNALHFDRWRSRLTSFDRLDLFDPDSMTLTGAGEPAQLNVIAVTGGLLETLGAAAARGRLLARDDERLKGEQVVVLTDSLWRERFGADASVIGRTIALDGSPAEVIGILPRDFRFLRNDDLGRELVRLPATVDAFIPFRVDLNDTSPRGDYNYPVIARLRNGVSLQQADAELQLVQKDVDARIAHEPGLRARMTPLYEAMVGRTRRGLVLLLAAIGAVLLIACANLANLSLTRATARLKETAVRSALGASRGRLVAKVLIEQLALTVSGAAAGLLLARAALVLFLQTAPSGLPRVEDIQLESRAVIFTFVVSLLSTLLVAVLPALRIARSDLQSVMRRSSAGAGGDRSTHRTRNVLVATQVALSVTLLIVTALLTISFARVMRQDRGFSTDSILAVDLTLPAARYQEDDPRKRAYDRVIEQVRTVPGVMSVAWTSMLPLRGESWVDLVSPEGRPPGTDLILANYRFVSADFFKALTVPFVRGRALQASDVNSDTLQAAVISERTAGRVWPGIDAVGRRFKRSSEEPTVFEVVGVVRDGRPTTLEGTAPLMVYVPYSFRSRTRASLVVRTAVEPTAIVPTLQHAVWTVDPDIAVANARPLEALVDAALGGRRFQVRLFVGFGAIALLIAIVGVYAVATYSVTRRRREMNIRVALGAAPARVTALVVRQSFAPVAVGVIAGAIGSLALGSMIAGLLFEVRARDPIVITACMTAIASVGLLAALLAAKNGLRLDPAAALRDE